MRRYLIVLGAVLALTVFLVGLLATLRLPWFVFYPLLAAACYAGLLVTQAAERRTGADPSPWLLGALVLPLLLGAAVVGLVGPGGGIGFVAACAGTVFGVFLLYAWWTGRR